MYILLLFLGGGIFASRGPGRANASDRDFKKMEIQFIPHKKISTNFSKNINPFLVQIKNEKLVDKLREFGKKTEFQFFWIIHYSIPDREHARTSKDSWKNYLECSGSSLIPICFSLSSWLVRFCAEHSNTQTHTHRHTHTDTQTHTLTHRHTHIDTHTYTHTQTHAHMHIHTHTDTCTHTYTHTDTRTHAHTQTLTQTHTHRHMHTHTHRHKGFVRIVWVSQQNNSKLRLYNCDNLSGNCGWGPP